VVEIKHKSSLVAGRAGRQKSSITALKEFSFVVLSSMICLSEYFEVERFKLYLNMK